MESLPWCLAHEGTLEWLNIGLLEPSLNHRRRAEALQEEPKLHYQAADDGEVEEQPPLNYRPCAQAIEQVQKPPNLPGAGSWTGGGRGEGGGGGRGKKGGKGRGRGGGCGGRGGGGAGAGRRRSWTVVNKSDS